MALINRVSRLLRADLHAVMDRVEEPEVLLRQAVREMDASIAEDRTRTKLLTHERNQLDARLRESRDVHERLAEELDVCFDAGQEELARALVKKRLERVRADEVMTRRRDGVAEALLDLERRMDENQARLDAVREKLDLLGDEDIVASPAETTGIGQTAGITAQDVEVAFLAEMRRRGRS